MRKLADDAVNADPAISLSAALRAAAFGVAKTTLSGKVVIEAQASGIITRFQLPVGVGALQPQEVAALLSRLLDLYDRAVAPADQWFSTGYGAGLLFDPPLTAPTDVQILAWMLEQLQVIRSYATDFTNPFLRP